jgi:SAM-dependent methyltransferase
MSPKSDHWKRHYRACHSLAISEGIARSLEYSNERCQIQTYGHLIEAVGPLSGRTVLDVGCGWGTLSRIFRDCGARVTGVDIVPETIAELQRRHPEVDWRVVDAQDERQIAELGEFDAAVAVEVLQYIDFAAAVTDLWRHVSPGGRLVGCVPNAECPIALRVRERYGGLWTPPSLGEIKKLAAGLTDKADFRVKGLAFREDQSFLPYQSSDWSDGVEGLPNRLLFVIRRETRNKPGVGR